MLLNAPELDLSGKAHEIEAIMKLLESEGIVDDPAAKARFLEALGTEGYTNFWDIVNQHDRQDLGALNDELRLLAQITADSVHLFGDDFAQQFLYEVPPAYLYGAMRLEPWVEDATHALVDAFLQRPHAGIYWAGDLPPSLVSEFAPDGTYYPGSLAEAGMALLVDRPEVAHTYLTDPGRRDALEVILTNASSLAPQVIEAGLLATFQTTPEMLHETGQTFAWLADEGVRVEGDGNRLALTRVGGQFLEEMARTMETVLAHPDRES